MTAHRPRKTGSLEDAAFIEVLYSGTAAPRSGWIIGRHNGVWSPPTDVFETEEALIVRMEVAGVQQSDFYVTLDEQHLTINGARFDPATEPRAYHQMEIHYGEFRTEVDLPVPVDENRIEAEYHDGFLRVTLPKAKPHRVHLK